MNAVIIGAGASGLACAIRMKQNMPGCSVIILEQLEIPGKKLYATGNGRCNLTNTGAAGYNITKEFFESLGLVMRTAPQGRVYPYSLQATTVAKLLLDACEKYDIKIIGDCYAYKIEKEGKRFKVFANFEDKMRKTYYADFLVLATGGKAQPHFGSNGSGYALAKMLGHSITKLYPALVPLESSSKHCHALKGTRIKCNLSIEVNSKILDTASGELLFTDYGISGIVTMDLSHLVNDEKLETGEDSCVAIIDLAPSLSKADLVSHIKKFGSLEGILPLKLWEVIKKQSEGDPQKAAQYTKKQRMIITRTRGYRYAQVTGGGVPAKEIGKSGESLKCDNLYIVGELANKQFRCGGYNLDNAFSSAVRAADDITEKSKRK